MHQPNPPDSIPPSPPTTPNSPSPINRTLSHDLDALRALADQGPLTFGQLVDALHDRAGISLLVILSFAFMLVPVPGVSTAASVVFFALAFTAVFATRPYLPGWVRRRSISQPNAQKMLAVSQRAWDKVSWIVRPRLQFLTGFPLRYLAGLSLFAAIVAFALPIPIPFNNSPPAFCILLLALGLLGRDGLLMLAGHLATLIMWIALFLAGDFLYDLIRSILHRISGS